MNGSHPEVVGLGEPFLLFDPARNSTQIRLTDDQTLGGITSHIRLDTGLLEKLPLTISAAAYVKQRAAVITPFHPELGYPVDEEDFSPRNRLRKLSSHQQELAQPREGISLVAFVPYAHMSWYRPDFQENGSAPLSDEVLTLLTTLFLTLTFPNGASFTSRARLNVNSLFLMFRRYFPTDTGPLPGVSLTHPAALLSGEQDISEKKGEQNDEFDLLLPFDLQKLQSIKGKFLLLPGAH